MDYDSWKTGDDDYGYEMELGYSHKNDLDHIKDYMTGVIELIYGSKKLDKTLLEDYLSEICSTVGLRIPKTPPMIERT